MERGGDPAMLDLSKGESGGHGRVGSHGVRGRKLVVIGSVDVLDLGSSEILSNGSIASFNNQLY